VCTPLVLQLESLFATYFHREISIMVKIRIMFNGYNLHSK